MRKIVTVMLLVLIAHSEAYASDLYVDINGTNPIPPYSSLNLAATNIQDAVNISSNGDSVLINSGTYLLQSEIMVTNNLTLVGINGPSGTIIDGGGISRCINLGNTTSVVSGITISNGFTTTSGGGIYASSIDALLTNCTIVSSTAELNGGGVHKCTLFDCLLKNNVALNKGGGTFWSSVKNSKIFHNQATGDGGGLQNGDVQNSLIIGNVSGGSGGGTALCWALNCTFVDNTASIRGGASYKTGSRTDANCIAYNNFAPEDPNIHSLHPVWYCCAPELEDGRHGCITNDPSFIHSSGGDYSLQTNSPCINWGVNVVVAGHNNLDLGGNPRKVEEYIDMGCYEYQGIINSLDSDNDSLPDEWERTYFGGNASPTLDNDNDMSDNLSEYISGMIPTNQTSVFSITYTNANGIISWPSITNRLYSVMWSTNLIDGFISITNGLPYPINSFTNASGFNRQEFYRVGVRIEP